jgi:hypothetical protein
MYENRTRAKQIFIKIINKIGTKKALSIKTYVRA